MELIRKQSRAKKLLCQLRQNRICVRCKTTTIDGHLDPKYQFIQQSSLPMLYFQSSLPRLPIPLLERTCDRYLNALRPLVIDERFRKTEEIVGNFKTKTGYQLQKLLKDRDLANKQTSYISEPWFDMYLSDRRPLPINYNPILIMRHDARKEYNEQLIRASNIIVSSLRFMRALREECLAPEVFHLNPAKSDTERFRRITKLAPRSIATYVAYAFKAFPLDMSQYMGLFGATRIPEMDKDRIYRNIRSRHVLIMRNGNFYAIDVLSPDGLIESPKIILDRVKRVLEDKTPKNPYPLGVLTAINRNDWASLRHHLIDIGNEKALKSIDSALFCICLDNISYDDANPIPIVKEFLSGDGTNRWFDKSLSIFIAKDGTTGINFEHSWGDGVAVLRYFNEIYEEINKMPFVTPNMATQPSSDQSEDAVKLIEIKMDDRMKTSIQDATKSHTATLDSLELNFLRYDGVSKKFCKKHAVSPDCVMQLAFQLAYKKAYDQYVATYESCSTAAFRHGRTETMRPCTVATRLFCDSATTTDSEKLSANELRSMILDCSAVHSNLVKEAAMGQGFDRHLFGLRHMAEINDMKMPNIFTDTSYELMNKNIISTSTLSAPGMLAGGFGPVVSDGYGIGYSIQNDECGAIVSSYRHKRNGKEFVDSLERALKMLRDILTTK